MAAVAVLFACGLPSFEVIYEPYAKAAGTTGNLEFLHNTLNASSTVFVGYEIYYRLYVSESVARTEIAAISAFNQTEPSNVVNRLTSTLGYQRISGSSISSGSKPVIAIESTEKSSSINFELTFSKIFQSETPQITIAANPMTNGSIRRNVLDPANPDTGKEFFAIGKTETAIDINRSGIPSTEEYYLQLYVLAYGISTTNFLEVYSQAVSLGQLLTIKAVD